MARCAVGADPSRAVDLAQLARVREDVGAATLRRYVAVYRDLLDSRLDRLTGATGTEGGVDVRAAAFDLRVSSAMLGTVPLAALTAEVGRALEAGVAPDAALTSRLRAAAEAVRVALP